ncbi:MAG: HlyC/CorC family transporter [Candidatus Eisenbacteria bacterium]|nr:HlyC/CorC family transporter [Candidatus Eisenbacteria bacterium]
MNPSVREALVLALVVLACLLGGAYASAAEMATISSGRIALRHRAKTGSSGAWRALRLLERRDQLLILFLVGQSVFSVLASTAATSLIERAVNRAWLASLIATAGMTTLIVVAADIAPKVVGKRQGAGFLIRDSRLLEFAYHLFLPITGIVSFYVRGVLHLFAGGRRRDPFVSREDLRVLVRESESRDETGRREKHMLESILDFRETVAREIMIPMNRVVLLESGSSTEAWRALVRREGYTRVPVYEQQRDRIVGLLNIFDLLHDPDPQPTVDAYLRPALIVPDSKRIDHLLVEMQKARNPMVVVVDEFGACQGIVTVEDIVEEIVGEMEDEHEPPRRKIRRLAPRVFVVEGLTDIDDLNQELKLRLPKRRYDTVGGMILEKAGRIPRVGERFTMQGIVFEVLESYPYGVRTLKVTLPPPGA